MLSDVHAQPLVLLETGLAGIIGADNMTGNPDSARNRACDLLGLPRVETRAGFPPTVARERIRPD